MKKLRVEWSLLQSGLVRQHFRLVWVAQLTTITDSLTIARECNLTVCLLEYCNGCSACKETIPSRLFSEFSTLCVESTDHQQQQQQQQLNRIMSTSCSVSVIYVCWCLPTMQTSSSSSSKQQQFLFMSSQTTCLWRWHWQFINRFIWIRFVYGANTTWHHWNKVDDSTDR